MSDPIRKLNAHGIPVVSRDGGASWERDNEAPPAVAAPEPVATPEPEPATTPVGGWDRNMTMAEPEPAEPMEIDTGTTPIVTDNEAAAPTDMGGWEDFARGQSQGATLGHGDEATAALLALGDDTERATRGYAGKPISAYTAIRDEERRLASESMQTPAGMAGKVFGGLTTTAPAMAVNPAGALARYGAQTAVGAGTGAVTAAGESEAETAGGVLSDAGEGGLWGGGVAGVFAAPTAIMQSMAPTAAKAANTWRGAAVGPYASDVKRMEGGAEALAEMGEAINRRGVDVRSSGIKSAPMTAGAYAKRIDEVKAEIWADIEPVLSQTNVDPRARMWIVNRLKTAAKALDSEVGDDARVQAAKLRDIAEMTASKESPQMSLKQVHELKKTLEGNAGFNARGASPSDASTATAYQGAARAPRDLMYEQVERNAPDQSAAFRQNMHDYGQLTTAGELAQGRQSAMVGNQLMSLPTVVAGAGTTGEDSLARMAAMFVANNYGKDITADVLEQAGRVGTGKPIAGAVGGLVGSQAVGVGGDGALDPAAILAEIDANPDAFGPYTGAMRDAALKGDEKAMSMLLMAGQ